MRTIVMFCSAWYAVYFLGGTVIGTSSALQLRDHMRWQADCYLAVPDGAVGAADRCNAAVDWVTDGG
jgi:hypothetical protein